MDARLYTGVRREFPNKFRMQCWLADNPHVHEPCRGKQLCPACIMIPSAEDRGNALQGQSADVLIVVHNAERDLSL